jgi:hypothetical protein
MAMANENQTPMKLDFTTMEMFEAFNLYMQQQQSALRKEFAITKCQQTIINKLNQFDGKYIFKYIQFYTREMEINKIHEKLMIESFALAIVPEI